jgi:hypothetical protein
MMQTREQARFALELLAQTFVGKERFFEGDSGIETLIDRLVNSAHSTLSELPYDTITAL